MGGVTFQNHLINTLCEINSHLAGDADGVSCLLGRRVVVPDHDSFDSLLVLQLHHEFEAPLRRDLPQKALSGGIPGAVLEPLVWSWSHFVGIYRQKLTNPPKMTFD